MFSLHPAEKPMYYPLRSVRFEMNPLFVPKMEQGVGIASVVRYK
jgi:hypothetical protein